MEPGRASGVTDGLSSTISTISNPGRVAPQTREPLIMPDRRLALVASWGAQLRALLVRRRNPARRAIAVAGVIAALSATIAAPPAPVLVWNVSASAPVGLYSVRNRGKVGVGDMVIARIPEPWRIFAAKRRYIPVNVPLVKRVAAVPGDRVCAAGHNILVNGRRLARRLEVDGAGRSMPLWRGCITLRDGALLLLIGDRASLDGRYFGATGKADVVGRAVPLWTD
jgi:conjugative transfer signal peptidase TraF